VVVPVVVVCSQYLGPSQSYCSVSGQLGYSQQVIINLQYATSSGSGPDTINGDVQDVPASIRVQGPEGDNEYSTSISQHVAQSGLLKLISYKNRSAVASVPT
jgi:hypothetical protein